MDSKTFELFFPQDPINDSVIIKILYENGETGYLEMDLDEIRELRDLLNREID